MVVVVIVHAWHAWPAWPACLDSSACPTPPLGLWRQSSSSAAGPTRIDTCEALPVGQGAMPQSMTCYSLV
eukprot:9320295-Heterocapsa_arctica.AAC.1